jgi:hypothetical protein
MSEFVEAFLQLESAEGRLRLIAEAPRPTLNKRLDALAGAVAHYLAHRYRLPSRPQWAFERERTLSEPWHTTYVDTDWNRVCLTDGMREYLSFASPAEFRSRNIFTEERPFRRMLTSA